MHLKISCQDYKGHPMEKSILQLSKESLTETQFQYPKTKTKPKPEANRRPGTAGRIGPATLPSTSKPKKKTEVGPRTKDSISNRVKTGLTNFAKSDSGKRIGSELKRHAVDTAIGAGRDIITGIGNRVAGRKNR